MTKKTRTAKTKKKKKIGFKSRKFLTLINIRGKKVYIEVELKQ